MHHPGQAELLLSRLVDALVLGPGDAATAGGEERPLLIQKNRRDAALVWDTQIAILLALRDDEEPGAEVEERVFAALSEERPDVREAARESTLVVILVGGRDPLEAYTASLPRACLALGAALRYLRVGLAPGAPVELATSTGKNDSLADRLTQRVAKSIEPALAAVRSDASPPPPPATRTALLESEREGEHVAAAEGAFQRRMRKFMLPGLIVLVTPQLLFVGLAMLCGGSTDGFVLSRMGSCYGESVREGQWWLLFSAGFLHVGIGHLASNVFGALYFAPWVQAALGVPRTLALFLLSSAAGFGLMVLVKPLQDGVGASGGVFGLMAALLALSLRKREFLPRTSRLGLGIFAVIYLVFNVFASLKPGVSMLGHVGGALAGFGLVLSGVATMGLPELDSGRPEPAASRLAGSAFLAAVIGISVLSCALALAEGRPWTVRWPPKAERVALEGTPLSIDVPSTLVASMRAHVDVDQGRWVFGRGRLDPLIVSVIAQPAGGDNAVSAVDPERLQGILAARGAGTEPDDFAWASPPRVVDLMGRKAVLLDQVEREADSVKLPRWIFGDAGYRIDVQVSISPAANYRWVERAEAIAASIAPRR